MCTAVSFVKSTRMMFKKNKKLIYEKNRKKNIINISIEIGFLCLSQSSLLYSYGKYGLSIKLWNKTVVTATVMTIGPRMIHTYLLSKLCVLQHLVMKTIRSIWVLQLLISRLLMHFYNMEYLIISAIFFFTCNQQNSNYCWENQILFYFCFIVFYRMYFISRGRNVGLAL